MKFKANVQISWEIDAPDIESAKKIAEEISDEFLKQNSSKKLTISRIKKKRRETQQLAEFSVEEVLAFVDGKFKKEFVIGDKSYFVKMNSQRYQIFKKSVTCAACGLVGSKMILEKNPSDKNPHFNLYAIENDELVLMTKDHIRPKAFGGLDLIGNFQTMCARCNNLKGSANLTLEDIKQLREEHRLNKHLPKKVLNDKLDALRKTLAKDHDYPKVPKSQLRTYMAQQKIGANLLLNTDINIWKLDDGTTIGLSIHAHPIKNGTKIGSLNCGATLEPVDHQGSKLVVKLSDSELFLLYQGYADYKE